MNYQGRSTCTRAAAHRPLEVDGTAQTVRRRQHGSGRKLGATLATTIRQDGAAGAGAHAQPETVGLRTAASVRLEGPLAHEVLQERRDRHTVCPRRCNEWWPLRTTIGRADPGPAPLIVTGVRRRGTSPCVGAQKYLERLSDVTPRRPPRSNRIAGSCLSQGAASRTITGLKSTYVTRLCITFAALIRTIHNLWTTVWTVPHHGRLRDIPKHRAPPTHETKESQWPTRTTRSATSGHRP